MKKVFLVSMMIVIIGALIFGGCAKQAPAPVPAPSPAPTPAPAPAPAPAEIIELKFAHHIPPTSGCPTVYAKFAEMVEEGTNGKVKITLYPSESLVKQPDFYDATVGGVCDMAHGGWTLDASRFRLHNVLYLPGLEWPDANAYTYVARKLREKFPEVRKESKEVKMLIISHNTEASIHMVEKEVHSPADLEGMKMIATGSAADTMEVLGAIPVGISVTEYYMALERGAADGEATAWCIALAHKLLEILKTHTEITVMGTSGAIIPMNMETWNSLSPDIQKVLEDSARFVETEVPAELTRRDDKGRQLAREANHTFIYLTSEERQSWIDALKPVQDKWVEEREAEGLPGRAVLEETLRLIEEYRNTLAK